MKTTDITLKECIGIIAELASKNECFVDEVPEVLQQDFKNFIIGHTVSTVDGRTITYDMKAYYKKIMTK